MRSVQEILQLTSDVLFPGDLEERDIRIDTRGYDGDTPLHVMLWRRDIDGIKTLIAAGADPNAVGDMNETPLHVAITQGMAEIVQLLMAAGANPDIRSEFGDTPRERAAAVGGVVAAALQSGGA